MRRDWAGGRTEWETAADVWRERGGRFGRMGGKKMSWLSPSWIITFGPAKCDVVEKVKVIVWK